MIGAIRAVYIPPSPALYGLDDVVRSNATPIYTGLTDALSSHRRFRELSEEAYGNYRTAVALELDGSSYIGIAILFAIAAGREITNALNSPLTPAQRADIEHLQRQSSGNIGNLTAERLDLTQGALTYEHLARRLPNVEFVR